MKSFVIAFAVVSLFIQPIVASCNERNKALLEEGRTCGKQCTNHADCKGPRKNCYCDGNCGMTCFNKDANCSVPTASANGKVSYKLHSYGNEAKHTCDNGYVKVGGSTIRVCRSDRKWSGTDLECAKGCKDPGLVGDAYVNILEDRNYRVGEKVTYVCDFGAYMTGDATRTCLNDSNWSFARFQCFLEKCKRPPYPENSIVEEKGREFGKKVFYQCKTGYTLVGSNSILCSYNGEAKKSYWRGNAPRCDIVRCDAPPGIANGTVKDENVVFEYNQHVTYVCDDGFYIFPQAHAERKCLETGEWAKAPICKQTYNCTFEGQDGTGDFCGYTQGNWKRDFLVQPDNTFGYVLVSGTIATLTSAIFHPQKKSYIISFYYKNSQGSQLTLTLYSSNGRTILSRLWSTSKAQSTWKKVEKAILPQSTSVVFKLEKTTASVDSAMLDDFNVFEGTLATTPGTTTTATTTTTTTTEKATTTNPDPTTKPKPHDKVTTTTTTTTTHHRPVLDQTEGEYEKGGPRFVTPNTRPAPQQPDPPQNLYWLFGVAVAVIALFLLIFCGAKLLCGKDDKTPDKNKEETVSLNTLNGVHVEQPGRRIFGKKLPNLRGCRFAVCSCTTCNEDRAPATT